MAKFHLTVKDFAPALKLNRKVQENMTVGDFLRCVYEVGARGPGTLNRRPDEYNKSLRSDARSYQHRLLWTHNDSLAIFDYWMKMDRSVMNISSYWIGMAFTKFVAEKVLRIPWLAYVDPLVPKVITVKPKNAKLRPDLVGHDSQGRWHVLESKAISEPMNKRRNFSYTKAEKQLDVVHKINRITPTTRSTCFTRLREDQIRVILRDPESSTNKNKIDITIDEDAFFREYYDPLISLVKERNEKPIEILDHKFLVCPFFEGNNSVFFGIQSDLVETPEKAPALTAWIDDLVQGGRSFDIHGLGLDGTFIVDLINDPEMTIFPKNKA